MMELVQGEGGVIPLPQAFVTALRDYCRQKDLLLLIDEVQTGVGAPARSTPSRNSGSCPM